MSAERTRGGADGDDNKRAGNAGGAGAAYEELMAVAIWIEGVRDGDDSWPLEAKVLHKTGCRNAASAQLAVPINGTCYYQWPGKTR